MENIPQLIDFVVTLTIVVPQELRDLIIKILIPSLVAVSIKLALESKKNKVSFFTAATSVITGVGSAYLTSGWVMESFKDTSIPLIIACITIVGEKVAYWLIYKFKFDIVGDAIIEYIVDRYKTKK